MQRRATADHTIVVRVWFEPHDDEPRARLFVIGPDSQGSADGGDERTERGVPAIERAVCSMLEQLIGRR